MKKIISQFSPLFYTKTIIKPNENIICAVSGGQDSILLFFLLMHLQKQSNTKIQLIHFNHFSQQKNFYFMDQIWKLSFIFKNPIYLVFSEDLFSTEKKAREWRQDCLNRISNFEHSNKILTGHTASDRIETSCWHLIRGTSPKGLVSLKPQTILVSKIYFFPNPKNINFLKTFFFKKIKIYKKNIFIVTVLLKKKNFNLKGIYFYQHTKNRKKLANFFSIFVIKKTNNFYFLNFSIFQHEKKLVSILFFNFLYSKKNILRPLLIFHRNDITFFAKRYLLPIINDPTNTELCWSRNRIRHQFFPLIRFFFNLHTESFLNNFLEITSEEQKYIESLTDKILAYWLIIYDEISLFQIRNINDFHIEIKIKKQYLLKIFLSEVYFQFQIFPKALQRRLVQKLFLSYKDFQLDYFKIELLRKKL